jgi:hypothetical protein
MRTILYIEANYNAVKTRWRKLMDDNLGDIKAFSEIRKFVHTSDTKYLVKSANDSWQSYCGLRYDALFIDEYADMSKEHLFNISCRRNPI